MTITPAPSRSRFAWLHPRAYLGIHGLVGLVISIGCAWFFFAIADEFPEKGALARADTAVTAWLQGHGTEVGESVFVGISWLGAQILIALIIAVAIGFMVRRDWRRTAALALTCGGGALLDVLLKTVFHRSRPTFASEFHIASWSFPSGHAMNTLVVYGLFAYWLSMEYPRARHAIVAGAVAITIAVGYARVYLGVHYLSDVLGGYAAGSAWLMVCITGQRFAERRRIGSSGANDPARVPGDEVTR